jgi:hypothetical protein
MVKRLWTALLAISLCTATSANIGRFSQPDPRLDKKVTLDVNHVKLEEVAKTLSEQTGVTIKAGQGERDWRTREQHVCIHAKDVPACDVLDQVTKLLSFCISREGKENEWTYIIWQDKKGRDLEAEMLNAQREEAAQRVARSRQGTVDLARDALEMSPEEAMKQKDKNPVLAYMGGTKTGRGFAGFLMYFRANFPTEYDLMMRGKRVFVPLYGLPAYMQQALTDMTSGGMADAVKQAILEEQSHPGDELPSLTPYQMLFQPASEESGPNVEGLGFGGLAFITGLGPDGKQYDTQYGGGLPMSACALTDPDTALGKALGEMLLSIEDGMPLDEANKQTNERVNNNPEFVAEALARESPTEKDPPTDPELTREVEIKDVLNGASAKAFVGEYQWKVLAEIARATGSPVLKESFDTEMVILGLFVHPGKQALYKVLIGLEKAGCTWARDDGVLRIRPSNWALLRSYKIPESFIAHHKDLLDTNGELSLDDVAAIAGSLTDEQIRFALAAATDLHPAVDCITSGRGATREILRLYASLTQEQKDALSGESGLPFSQLANAQWDRLSMILEDRLGGQYIQDGSIRLLPQTEKQIKEQDPSRKFEITVQVSGDEERRKISEWIQLATRNDIKAAKEARKKAANPAPAK